MADKFHMLSELQTNVLLGINPWVAQLVDVIPAESNSISLIFQKADGDLRMQIKQTGGLDATHVQHLVLDMLGALDHIHTAGVVHADISPRNILARGARYILCDFGLAVCLPTGRVPKRQSTYIMGIQTCAYRAPEVISQVAEDWSKIDMWSLGCIAYEAATGEPLFRPKSEVGLALQMCTLMGSAVFADFGAPFYVTGPALPPKPIPEVAAFGRSGMQLLRELLQPLPASRVSAQAALACHAYASMRPCLQTRKVGDSSVIEGRL